MKTSVANKIVLGFAMSVAAMILIGSISVRITGNLIRTEEQVSHTHEVLAKLEAINTTLFKAESSTRGYVLTGDPDYLDNYHEALNQFNSNVDQLKILTSDNPAQQARLVQLKELLEQRIAIHEKRIRIRQTQGMEAAATSLSQDSLLIKKVKSDIQAVVADMKANESFLLTQRKIASKNNAILSIAAIVFGVFIASLVGLAAVVVIRRDLEKRARTEQEIHDLYHEAPCAYQTLDLQGRVMEANNTALDWLGYQREELVEKVKFTDLLSPASAIAFTKAFSQIRENNSIDNLEIEVLRKNGSFFPALLNARLVREKGGQSIAVRSTLFDITDRKRAAHAHLRFQALFESLPGLYLILTPDLKIVTASDAYLEATMTQREKIAGRDLFEIFPDNPDDLDANGASNVRASLDRVLKTGKQDAMAIQKYDVRRPDGVFEERYWSPINSPLFGPDGRIEYIIHRVEDVTDFVRSKQAPHEDPVELLKKMERMEAEIFQSNQAVQTANQQLQAANKELESFSYSVSHDLRAPLRHIDGFIDLLGKSAMEKLNETEKRYFNIVADSARQMGALIDDLLVFSRMARTELHNAQTSMNQLVREVITSMQPDLQGREIIWKIDVLPEVKADTSMIRQVWANLIGNAVKYSRPRNPALIEIQCDASHPNEFVFSIRDNGVGFDMKYVHKLFGVFQRLHRASEFEGTGIGLANVQRIVSRHGGRTWAESTVNQGSTFFFSLPKGQEINQG